LFRRRDLERFHSLSHADFSWVGTCKHLIFPVHPAHGAPLSALSFADLVLHFQTSAEASVLLWGVTQDQVDALTYDYCRPVRGSLRHPDGTAPADYARRLPRLIVSGAGPVTVPPMHLTEEEHRGLYSTFIDAPPASEQASDGIAPWQGCACCWAREAHGIERARALREKTQRADGFRLHLAAAHVDVKRRSGESCWPCSYDFGEVGVYRAILPRSARLAFALPPRSGPMPPLHQSTALPFQFDGVSFRALVDQPLSGAFGAALASVLSLLPAQSLAAHLVDSSYLSSRHFAVVAPPSLLVLGSASGPGPSSFAQLLVSVLCHRLRQECESAHQ